MSQARHEDEIDEIVPLLQHAPRSDLQDDNRRGFWKIWPIRVTRVSVTTLVPVIGLLTVFLNEAEFFIKSPAQLRMIEAIACFEYYAKRDNPLAHLGKSIPELNCKMNAIQERTATLYGTTVLIRMICAVLGTFFLLHRFKAGRRRPVLILHKANLILTNILLMISYFGYPKTPIWLFCLTGITSLIGGNFDLGTSTLFAAYADIIDDATRRSNLIFVTSSLQFVAQASCLPITGRLMSIHGPGTTPEISVFVATACSVLVFVLNAFFFPETYRAEQGQDQTAIDSNQRGKADSSERQDPNPNESSKASTQETERSPLLTGPTRKSSVSSTSSLSPYQVLLKEFGVLQVIFLLLAMLCATAGTRIIDWYGLLQYPGIKFKWTLSKTTYLICMQAVLSFLNFALVLPTINKTCQHRFGMSARSSSVVLTVASALVIAVCTVVLGLPGTNPTAFVVATAIYTLGSGVASGLQTYTVNTASSPRSSGAALTIVSLAATFGKVFASAIWPAALTAGLEHPSGKLGGLPFFIDTILLVVVAVSICVASWASRVRT